MDIESLIKNTQMYKHRKPYDEVITDEFVNRFSKSMSRHGLSGTSRTMHNMFKDSNKKIFTFDGGWAIISLKKFRNEKALFLDSVYLSNKTPIDRKLFWKEFDDIAKCLNCKYIVFDTVRSPEAFKRAHNYELFSYKLGKKIQ